MAGTIVSDTLQDGSGNSTATTNAIMGSAKAWVNFNGVSGATIRASYNVSSVTRTTTGTYTINFTNAFVDANYVVTGSSGGTDASHLFNKNGAIPQTSSYVSVVSIVSSVSTYDDSQLQVAIFR
jgi:hypothetical protein